MATMPSEINELLRNHVKEKLGRGEVVASMTVRLIQGIEIARIAKTAGFDSLYVDLEHSSFSLETAGALVDFWKQLTAVLFSVIPAVVAIGVVVGGIVIMNIMLMSVSERTREIGIRKAVGARSRDIERQFLAEAIALATTGGALGVLAGWGFAELVAAVSPLPARITAWSVLVALALGATVGVLFGVYPARRAARLDPITALRAE